ncbi:MAG: hypothetical protein GKR90_03160 [Pseudomonadales bacterium]|nr:hypothetical protein [Pseudomonadales bacterium]
MSEQLRESLSAVMDGEADAFELRRVLDESKNDPQLRELWHRQHLVRDILRGDEISHQLDLRARLLAEMEELDAQEDHEPIPEAQPSLDQTKKTPWLGRLTGTAVAATVALLVIVGGDYFTGGSDDSGFVGPEIAQSSAPTNRPAATAPVMYEIATPADRQRTDALIIHHLQQNALNQPGGFSFVRWVGFDRKTAPNALRPQSRVQPGRTVRTPSVPKSTDDVR